MFFMYQIMLLGRSSAIIRNSDIVTSSSSCTMTIMLLIMTLALAISGGIGSLNGRSSITC